MSLEQLLEAIREYSLILTYGRTGRVVLWTSCTRVPRSIRQAVAFHREELQRLIEAADIRVCAAIGLHRSHWIYTGMQEYRCEMCRQLNQAIRQRSVA